MENFKPRCNRTLWFELEIGNKQFKNDMVAYMATLFASGAPQRSNFLSNFKNPWTRNLTSGELQVYVSFYMYFSPVFVCHANRCLE